MDGQSHLFPNTFWHNNDLQFGAKYAHNTNVWTTNVNFDCSKEKNMMCDYEPVIISENLVPVVRGYGWRIDSRELIDLNGVSGCSMNTFNHFHIPKLLLELWHNCKQVLRRYWNMSIQHLIQYSLRCSIILEWEWIFLLWGVGKRYGLVSLGNARRNETFRSPLVREVRFLLSRG